MSCHPPTRQVGPYQSEDGPHDELTEQLALADLHVKPYANRHIKVYADTDALDRAIGAWLADQQPAATATRPPPATRPAWRAVAVDGKTLRGTGHHGRSQVHLLAVMDHATRAGLGQADVDGKTNEITQFRPLLG